MAFDPMTGRFVEDTNRGGMMGLDGAAPHVFFHDGSILDKAASALAGRPIEKTVPFISIQHRGEKDVQDRPAHDLDVQNYKAQWQAYKEGREHIESGTPLALMFPTQPGLVKNFHFHKVFTIEMLANVTDTQAQNIGMGVLTFREAAKQFLAKSEKTREFSKLRDENEKLKISLDGAVAKMEQMTLAITELQSRIPKHHDADAA